MMAVMNAKPGEVMDEESAVGLMAAGDSD